MIEIAYRLQQPYNYHLAEALATNFCLKLEIQGALIPPPKYHALRSQPLKQALITIHDLPWAQVQPVPHSWNIWYNSAGQSMPQTPAPKFLDEIWVNSQTEQMVFQNQYPQLIIQHIPPSLDFKNLPPVNLEPDELELREGEKAIFLHLTEDLSQLKQALGIFARCTQNTHRLRLVLHLESDSLTEEALETLLIEDLESLCQELQLSSIEVFNLHTVIGPLETSAFWHLVHACHYYWNLNSNFLESLQALVLGKSLIGELPPALPPDFLSPASDLTSLKTHPEMLLKCLDLAKTPDQAQLQKIFAPENTLQAQKARLETLATTLDLSQRRAATQANTEQAKKRQGRKQKFSLFHGDYNPEELALRKKWHGQYIPFFKNCFADIVDLGCGSGIFLELLRELGLPSFGIDLDQDMVDVCHELGLQAILGDDRSLADFPPQCLGGIHASHIIEHIHGERAIALVENAYTVLKPGGIFIVRTPNWQNSAVRHEGFWLDITHIRPYPLPLLKQLFEETGFHIQLAGFEKTGWNDTFIIGQKPEV